VSFKGYCFNFVRALAPPQLCRVVETEGGWQSYVVVLRGRDEGNSRNSLIITNCYDYYNGDGDDDDDDDDVGDG